MGKNSNKRGGKDAQKKYANKPSKSSAHRNSSMKSKAADFSTKISDMRKRLEGSKFRMINEQLYTSKGKDSFQDFQKEPTLFDVYHRGFREMAQKWPVNPLDQIIQDIRMNHKQKIVADFGCGDAKLGASLSKTNKVYSFDLVSRNEQVIACDIAKVPLPDGAIDIAVYCLALMGVNLREFLMEARRVLKPNGLLKIAEVKSRFEHESMKGIDGFIDMMKVLGFKLMKKNEKNKMFVQFQFQKVALEKRKVNSKNMKTMQFKACEYKRR